MTGGYSNFQKQIYFHVTVLAEGKKMRIKNRKMRTGMRMRMRKDKMTGKKIVKLTEV